MKRKKRIDKEAIIETGKKVLDDEIKALRKVKANLGEEFVKAVELIYLRLERTRGKVIITGMGKSGLIGQKIAATLTSTGTPAYFLSPAEGTHGDIGIITRDDIVIALTKSGETDEIVKILPYLKRFGIPLITITAYPDSIIARHSDVVLNIGVKKEACPLNLAPTSSTTAQLALGDAIAVALLKLKNFTKEDFALLHPGGMLSKKLLKVKDIMHTGEELPIVNENATMREVISTIIEKKLGVAIIVNDKNKLTGIIVDGDLKRILIKTEHIMDRKAKEFMTKNPKCIDGDALVAEALKKMEGKITSLIIVNKKNEPVGLLHIHDILKSSYV